MMKWVLRIAGVLLVLTVLGAVGTYLAIDRSLVAMYGGLTPEVEVAPAADAPERFVLSNVRVLEPGSQRFSPPQDVLIEAGLIEAVGPELDAAGAPRLDGAGRYLMPGLTDSHVHLWRSRNDLALYLANGVTQIREMHGEAHHLEWRDQIEAGALAGPDIYVVAAQLATYDFAEGLWHAWTAKRNVVRTPREVRDTVRRLVADGYDAIKASSYLSLEGYQVASEAAVQEGVPLVGHVPVAARLDDLWASSQSEVAHVEELVKGLDRDFGGYRVSTAEEFLDYVRSRRDEVAQRLIDNEIVLASTLALTTSFAEQITDVDSALAGAPVEYVNPGVAEGRAMGWLPSVNRYRVPDSYRTEGWRERYSTYWNTYGEAHRIIFDALLAAGVPILAATDANVPVMTPGFSLHQELLVLEAAGMSRAQVLESATRAPAEWMGWNSGVVAPGYRANLVLLRENPLEDLRHTSDIDAVVMHGRVIDREELDALLRAVEDANETARTMPIDQIRADARG